jgi:hypothetical protein
MRVLDDYGYVPPETQAGVYGGSKYLSDWRIYPSGEAPADGQRVEPETPVVMRGSKIVIRIKAMGFNGPKYSFAEALGARYLRRLYRRLQRAGFPEVTTITFPGANASASEIHRAPEEFYKLTDLLSSVLARREGLYSASAKALVSALNAYNCGWFLESPITLTGARLRNDVGAPGLRDVWGGEFTEKQRAWCDTPLLNYLVIGDPTRDGWLLVRDRPEQTWQAREVAEALLSNMRAIAQVARAMEAHR